jgi:hypothetical protein
MSSQAKIKNKNKKQNTGLEKLALENRGALLTLEVRENSGALQDVVLTNASQVFNMKHSLLQCPLQLLRLKYENWA